MAWPTSSNYTTFTATVTRIAAAFLNAIQVAIRGLYTGSSSLACLTLDGGGGLGSGNASARQVAAVGGNLSLTSDAEGVDLHNVHVLSTNSGTHTPGVANGGGGGGAGFAASVSGNDVRGLVSVHTGALPAGGSLVRVTLHGDYGAKPVVLVCPTDTGFAAGDGAAAAGTQWNVAAVTIGDSGHTRFDIETRGAGVLAATDYGFAYWVIG